jgi:hypothetical protein
MLWYTNTLLVQLSSDDNVALCLLRCVLRGILKYGWKFFVGGKQYYHTLQNREDRTTSTVLIGNSNTATFEPQRRQNRTGTNFAKSNVRQDQQP